MLRDRAMSHYQARSGFGSGHRLNNRRNGLGYNNSRLTGVNRTGGVTIGQRGVSSSADGFKVKEIEGDPLVNAEALKSLIRLLRLAQVRGKLTILMEVSQVILYASFVFITMMLL